MSPLADRARELERQLWLLRERVSRDGGDAELVKHIAELAAVVVELAAGARASARRRPAQIDIKRRGKDGGLAHICTVTSRMGADRALRRYRSSGAYRRGNVVLVGPASEKLQYLGLTLDGNDVEYVVTT